MAEPGTVSELRKFYDNFYKSLGSKSLRGPIPGAAKRYRENVAEATIEALSKRRRTGEARMEYGPFTVPAPEGGMPYDVKALWHEINNREVKARAQRSAGRTLDAYQRAFFATFPHYLPYHVNGYPIRLTYSEKALWNRVKPARRRRRFIRRRRAPVRRRVVRRRVMRRK